MRKTRTLYFVALLATAGLLGAACDQGGSVRVRRTRGGKVVTVRTPAPAPAPEPAADPAPAPTAAAAQAEGSAQPAEAAAKPDDAEEPKDYKPEESLGASLVAEQPAAPAGAAAPPAPAPAEIRPTASKEEFADSEPPDPVYEEKPRAPSGAHVWTPGFWHWGGTRWGWRPGTWRLRPAGMNYIPPHYEVVGGRVVYVRPYWGPRVFTPYYGGRVLAMRYPLVRPAYWRPGVRYYVRPTIGYRIGSRPVAIYRTYPRVTTRIVVPTRPVRVVRPMVGVRPAVGIRPAMGVRPAVVSRPAVRVAPAPRTRRP